jgi:DNA (cytosine-5)-methyltransferase 1
VLACDIDKSCREVYKDNYGIEPVSNVKDIDENTMEDFDILCAGFPCFVEGTLTLTNSGYKNIEDVNLSDKLLTHTGKFQNILNLQRKIYTGDIYDFKIKYHPELISATEEHPFYVREQKKVWNSSLKKYDSVFGEPEWKIASKLNMNYYFGMVINNKEIIPEFTHNTEEINDLDYWFKIGYLVGDVYVEDEVSEKSNRHLIPEWVQDAPKNFIQEFINGYMRAVHCDENCTTSSYKGLAYGIQRLYSKLGHIFSVRECIESKTYILERIKTEEVSSFIDGDYVWYAPSKITKRKTRHTPVYNFEVENDNSYVVENVCVHNCQSFSNGGNKKCFEDERGLLFDEIIRIAKTKKPRFMFLENVKHILKVSNGEVIKYIKNKIDITGYTLQIFQISPHNYGIPQQRERVYFVCVRNDIYNGTGIILPKYSGKIEFQKFLDKEEEINPKYFIKDDTLNVLESWDKMVKQFEIGEKISPTIMMNDAFKLYTELEFNSFPKWKQDYITKNKPLIQKYRPQFLEWYNNHLSILQKREIYGKLEWQTGAIKDNDSIFNHFIQIRQSGIRVKKGHYFPTLVAISQIPIYGKEKRYITPRECARLQSFPETFKLSPDDKKSYKQLGNSVNVHNVYTVISSTLKNYMVV